MGLFDELFDSNKRNDEEFSHFLNEMMRRYESMMNSSMRNDFPFKGLEDFREERGRNWVKQSGSSSDGSLRWSSFTRNVDGEKLSEREINEMLNGMFNPNHRSYQEEDYGFRPRISKEQKLIMLRGDLEDAIEEEEFEKAAKLRDLINELENK